MRPRHSGGRSCGRVWTVAGEHAHSDYRKARANPCTLFYRFDGPRIVVRRIIHQRQDFDACSLVDLR